MGDRLARTLLRAVREDELVVQVSTSPRVSEEVGVCAESKRKRRLPEPVVRRSWPEVRSIIDRRRTVSTNMHVYKYVGMFISSSMILLTYCVLYSNNVATPDHACHLTHHCCKPATHDTIHIHTSRTRAR